MSVKCFDCFEIFDNKSKFEEHRQFCIPKGICNSCKNRKQLVKISNCPSCLIFLPEYRTCKRCIVQKKIGSQCDSCIRNHLKLSKSRSRKRKCLNCTNMYKRLKYLRKHLELLINESCLQNYTPEGLLSNEKIN